MLNVGFIGGLHLFETGPVIDMDLFFQCIDGFTQKHPDVDWTLITDRLYKKYLKEEEIPKAKELMEKIQGIFSEKSPSVVDWNLDEELYEVSELDFKSETLAAMFVRYFEGFNECCEATRLEREIRGKDIGYKYHPIRVVHSSVTRASDHLRIPLEVRDNLKPEDPPFWMLD